MGEIIYIISIPVVVGLFLLLQRFMTRDKRARLRHRRGQRWLPPQGTTGSKERQADRG